MLHCLGYVPTKPLAHTKMISSKPAFTRLVSTQIMFMLWCRDPRSEPGCSNRHCSQKVASSLGHPFEPVMTNFYGTTVCSLARDSRYIDRNSNALHQALSSYLLKSAQEASRHEIFPACVIKTVRRYGVGCILTGITRVRTAKSHKTAEVE